jgi:hypothetical protein
MRTRRTRYISDKIRNTHAETKAPYFDREIAIILDASRRQGEVCNNWNPEYRWTFCVSSLPSEQCLVSFATKDIIDNIIVNNLKSKKQYGRNARRSKVGASVLTNK